MDAYAVRTLRSQPLRLALTIGGVALCIVLMFFLLAVYRGVADGSVDYIRKNATNLWVLQRNVTNILRGSSLVPLSSRDTLRKIPGVESVSPVLLLLTTVKKQGRTRTVFLTGFEPATGAGGPPKIVEGRTVRADDEIVFDRAFARKFGFRVGESIDLLGHSLRVVGVSTGTNAFVIQYAFVTLPLAQKVMGFPGIVSCFLVSTSDGNPPGSIAGRIEKEQPGLAVYEHAAFLENNIQEMKSGFLPLLYTVAAIGAIVLTVILSLLLSVNILERRKDYAVLKTLGSPRGFLRRIIVVQALLISSSASLVGILLFFPLVAAIENLSPEITAKSTPGQILAVIAAVACLSLVSSAISIQKLRRIYLLEVFR